MCVWPGSTWCAAPGITAASAALPLRIQAGLLPPAMTTVGAVTDAHSVGDNGRPACRGTVMARSCGSVGATAFSFDHIGISRIITMPIRGTPTIRMKCATAAPYSRASTCCCICRASASVIGGRVSSTMKGGS